MYNIKFSLIISTYPSNRCKTLDNGENIGVIGTVSLVQNVTFSSQPISSLDWSPDKVNTSIS